MDFGRTYPMTHISTLNVRTMLCTAFIQRWMISIDIIDVNKSDSYELMMLGVANGNTHEWSAFGPVEWTSCPRIQQQKDIQSFRWIKITLFKLQTFSDGLQFVFLPFLCCVARPAHTHTQSDGTCIELLQWNTTKIWHCYGYTNRGALILSIHVFAGDFSISVNQQMIQNPSPS